MSLVNPGLGLTSRIPIVSDVEEARALQFRCECLEVACLQDRKSAYHYSDSSFY